MKHSTKQTIKNILAFGTLAIAPMVSCTPAKAADLLVMGVSKHFASEEWKKTHPTTNTGDFNEVNPGIGVWVDVDSKNALVSGVYHNSYARTTVFMGGSRHLVGSGMIQLRVDYGLATGYQSSVVPMVAPVVEVHTGPIVTRALIIPKVSDDTVTAVGIQWKFKF